MLKINKILPVLVVVLFLALGSTAFAQMACSVSTNPVSRDTDTGLTEPAGDITFTCGPVGASGSTAATVTVSYGVPITSSTAYPAGKPIGIVSPTGMFTVANVSVASVNNSGGSVLITVGPQAAGGTGQFTLQGVLLGLGGSGAVAPLKATISTSPPATPGTGVSIVAGQDTPTVVSQIQVGIRAPTVTTGPGIVSTSGTVVTSAAFTINVLENYFDMYRALAQFNGGVSTQGVQLLVTFANIPTGVTLSGCSVAATGVGATAAPFIVGGATTVTSAAPTLIVEIGGTANLSASEGIALSCTTFAAGATATLPLAPGNITASVTLTPNGAALCAAAACTTPTTGQIPRYTVSTLGPVNVISIVSLTTHMLMPFVSIGNGFDTGFVITNTTADPYGFTAGAVNTTGGARPASGPVTLAFYPSGGTPFCASTGAGAPPVAGVTAGCTTLAATGSGLGLSSGGVVASGSSWVVLGSEILKQITSAPAVFNGYVFGITNFPFAHPTAFVADATFSGKFTAGGPALVLSNPQVLARTTVFGAGLVETLGH